VSQGAQPALLAREEQALRRWGIAASAVAAAHAAFLFWLMHRQDLSRAGAPPAAVLIDLPPMDVSSPAQPSPALPEGPQRNEAEPEKSEQPETRAAPQLPQAQKPAAILTSPAKPNPKPNKTRKEVSKPAVKRALEPPAPSTTAPRASQAARGQTQAAPLRGETGSAAAAASWRAQIFAHLLAHKPGGGAGAGAVSIAFTLTRSGRLVAARLAASSGNSALDSQAMEMVRRANPFPAAPSGVSGNSFQFAVPVRFR
jgi:protein TonB